MNLLIIRSSVNYGGPGKQLVEEVKEFQKSNINVICLVGDGNYISELKKVSKHVFVIDGLSKQKRNLISFLLSVFKTKNIIKKYSIDYAYGMNLASSYCAFFASLISFRKIKILNSILGSGKENWFRRSPFHHIVLSNEQCQKLIKKGFKKNKMSVVYPSTITKNLQIETKNNSFRKSKNLTNEFLIATVMMKKKGHKNYADLVKKELLISPKVRHIFVGDSEMYEIYKKELNDDELKKVFFLGLRNDVLNILSECDVLSHVIDKDSYETFGMVVTEAMILKKPVIASKIGGPIEIIENNETGFLIDDFNQYIQKMTLLFNEKSLRDRMGINGRERAIKKFTIESGVQKIINILKSMK